MTDHPTPNHSQLDERLAEFTDRLLDGSATEVEELEMATQNQELLELQKIVSLLGSQARKQQPEEAMAARIKSRLVDEWEKHGPGSQVPPEKSRQPWWRIAPTKPAQRPRGRQRQVFALALAGAALVVLLLLLPLVLLSPPDGSTVTGAASIAPPIILIVGFLVGGTLLWLLSRNRK